MITESQVTASKVSVQLPTFLRNLSCSCVFSIYNIISVTYISSSYLTLSASSIASRHLLRFMHAWHRRIWLTWMDPPTRSQFAPPFDVSLVAHPFAYNI